MRQIIPCVAVLLALLLMTPNLASASTKQPFSATLVTPEGGPLDCVRTWINGSVFHARGCNQEGTITGDLNGTMVWTLNLNFLACCSGPPQDGTAQVKGTITLDGQSTVSYTISLEAHFQDGAISGRVLIDGVGSFEGAHIVGTILGTSDGPVDVTGTMITKQA